MSAGFLTINLIVSIAIILILILKFKVNPTISMVIASLYMGLSCKLGLVGTVESINSGLETL